MDSEIPRTHRKSRTGCVTCKARKIKCDEGRPVCRNCQRKFPEKLCCIYDAKPAKPRIRRAASQPPNRGYRGEGTSSSSHGDQGGESQNFDSSTSRTDSPPPMPPRPFSQQSLDLRLWHHYLTETSCTLPPPHRPQIQALWYEDVPKWAYQHDFLLDALFGMTSIHIYYQTQEQQFLTRAYKYYAEAASKYSKALSRASADMAAPILATSLFIGFQTKIIPRLHAANEPYKLPISTFHLQRGVPTTYKAVAPLLPDPNHRITGLFLPPSSLDAALPCEDLSDIPDWIAQDAQDLLHALARSETMGPAAKEACKSSFALILSIHRSYEKRGAEMMHCRRNIPAFFWTVPWLYVELLEQREPIAMLILARYFAISKAGEEFWWVRGLAEREIFGIASIMPSEWSTWMEFPFSLLAKINDSRHGSIASASPTYSSASTAVMST